MKYLKKYNENLSNEDIIDDCKQILVDMSDDYVKFDIRRVSRVHLFGSARRLESIQSVIQLTIGGYGGYTKAFNPGNYIETLEHLNSYLNSNGYKYFSNGTKYSTWEEKMESIQDKGMLTLMDIYWVKDSVPGMLISRKTTESMRHLKRYESTTDINRDVNDISLELLDKGLKVDISWTPWSNTNKDCDIIIWKHNGNEWHIPFDFDQDCIDFALRINDYMISNGLYLVKLTTVRSDEPNTTFSSVEKAIKPLSKNPVEEVYFNFSNHEIVRESNNYKDIVHDIEDILLEVEDIGLTTGVVSTSSEEEIKIYIEHNPSIDDYSDPFHFSDVRECIERLIEYMDDLGYHEFIYSDLYTEFNFNRSDWKMDNAGELDNLKRELDYYLAYEPEDEEAIKKIEDKMQLLSDTSNTSEPNLMPQDEEVISVIRLTFSK